MTAAIVLVPFAGLAVAVWLAWGHGLGLADVLLALAFCVLTGLGVTVGFHRLLAHRSFTAARPLRVALAVAGSMSFEGDVIGWVAIHRRHHAFTGRPGDPHSPYRYGTSLAGQIRGLAHAHAGWLLRDDPTPPARYAPDIAGRPRHAYRLGWLPCPVRRLPGPALRGRVGGPLAVVSFGESWHNMHHSDPACARHGVNRGQAGISAALIRILERLGWATGVHWPGPACLAAHRRNEGHS